LVGGLCRSGRSDCLGELIENVVEVRAKTAFLQEGIKECVLRLDLEELGN